MLTLGASKGFNKMSTKTKNAGFVLTFCLIVACCVISPVSLAWAQDGGSAKKPGRPAVSHPKNDVRNGAANKNDHRKKGTPGGPRQDDRNWGGGWSDRGGMPHMGNMADLKKKHPEFYELIQEDMNLNRKTRELVSAWKEAAADKKGGIKAELLEVATEHFQVRKDRQLYELKLLEERIESMRKGLERRDAKKDSIINHRVKELLEKDEDMRF